MVNPTVKGKTDDTKKLKAIEFLVLLKSTSNDKELSNQFLEKFTQEITQRKATIQAIYQNEGADTDLEKLDYHIHKLNGSARFCGFLLIQDIATQIEDIIYRKELHELDKHMKALFEAIDETIEAYKQKNF